MNFEISTENLLLKVLREDDANLVLDFYERNADVFEKYEPINDSEFYTISHQKKLLEYEYQYTLKLSMIRYWIFEKNNPNTIIGTVSFRNILRLVYQSCTIGYKMDKDFLRKGYCSEALEASIKAIANDLDIHRFEALILPENTPSINLAKKLGFEFEGILRDKITIDGKRLDHCMFSYLFDN